MNGPGTSAVFLALALAGGCAGTGEPPEATESPRETGPVERRAREPTSPAEAVLDLPAIPPPVDDEPEEPPPTGGEPYPIGGDVLRPRRIAAPHSEEFQDLVRSGAYIWGSCILGAVITREGRVDELELLKPDAVAPEIWSVIEEMFRGWRFEPATRHGEPVAVRFNLVIHHCPMWPRGMRPAVYASWQHKVSQLTRQMRPRENARRSENGHPPGSPVPGARV